MHEWRGLHAGRGSGTERQRREPRMRRDSDPDWGIAWELAIGRFPPVRIGRKAPPKPLNA